MLLKQCTVENEHVCVNILDHFGISESSVSVWTLYQRLMFFFTAPALPFLWCARHMSYCFLEGVDLDASGFPCVDWSPAGRRLGIYGESFAILLCLIAWHRAVRTRLVLLENVPQFSLSVLEALAGDVYTIHAFYISPADVGFEVLSRKRLFMLLLLRGHLSFNCLVPVVAGVVAGQIQDVIVGMFA